MTTISIRHAVKRKPTRDEPINDNQSDWIHRDPQCHLKELIIEILQFPIGLIEGIGDIHRLGGCSSQAEDRDDRLFDEYSTV
jgi:hypothetical protein